PFGLIIGSFLNVVAYRLPRGESLVSPPSHCPGCDTPIRPWDNLPVVSWLLLRGRCRHCSARISPRYPLIELITAGVFGAAALAFLLVTALIYPAGMGMGDVKLAGVMGLYLGASVAPALLIAFLTGSLVGVAIMLRHGAKGRKKGVPFAPFLAFGGVVGLLVGAQLVHLYTHHYL